MQDKIVHTIEINGVTVKIFEEKSFYRSYYTENPEHSLFIESTNSGFCTILERIYNSRSLMIKLNPDEIQDAFIKNPLKLDEIELKKYYLQNICIENPPSKLKYNVDITEVIPTYHNFKMLKLFDLADWSKHDDKAKMKIIRDVSKLVYRKTARAEVLSSFDCIGKITDPKVGMELAKLLKSAGLIELYAKALSKFGTNDVLGKIIETGDIKAIYKVYILQPVNIKKAYHPDMIKILPKIISLVDLNFIKELETLDEVKWNLFGTEYAPSINLKNSKIDVMVYLIDKLEVALKGKLSPLAEVENKRELLDIQIQVLAKEKEYEKKVLLIENMHELVKKIRR